MADMKIQFAAIDRVLDPVIPADTENDGVRKYVMWGKDNLYPEYLHSLYTDVTTLRTVIDGIADYTCGDSVKCTVPEFAEYVNRRQDTMRDLVWLLARDYLTYGGFAFQVVRDRAGRVGELHYLDFRYLRSSKNNDILYYSEEYGKKYVRVGKTMTYPKFVPEAVTVPSSVVYITNEKSRTYPVPRYSGSIRACEIERQIDVFHLSSLENGFTGSYIVGFYNGVPTDEEKAEIERNVNEKFAGSANAGRILLYFGNSKDNGIELNKLDAEDFGAKYQAAADRSRRQIFTAFRAIPQLFADMTASTGFSSQEFEEAFRVFNKTVVKPVQKKITDAIDRVLGTADSVVIEPFSLNDRSDVQ